MSIKKNHNEDEWKDKYDYQILINYNHIPKRWNISFNSKKKTTTTTTRDRSEEWKQKRVKRKEKEIKGSKEKREEDRSVERKARAN